MSWKTKEKDSLQIALERDRNAVMPEKAEHTTRASMNVDKVAKGEMVEAEVDKFKKGFGLK